MGADVPAGWRRVQLGDLATERRERAGESEAEVYSVTKYDGFVRSADYFDRQVFSRDVSGYRLVKRGDFAYATIHLDEGSLGLFESASFGRISPMYTVFAVDESQVDRTFLFAYLKQPTMIQAYARLGDGTVHRRKSIRFQALAKMQIDLPPLPEQRAIAAVLDAIDDAIERTETVIAVTERLRHALLHELLTRGVPGRHDEWKSVSGIGTIPACWEVVRVGKVLAATTYGTNLSLDGAGAVPVLRMNNLQEGEIDLSDVRRADLNDQEVQDLDLLRGDILFNRTNSLDLVGKVAIVRELPQPMSFASYLVRLRVQADRVDPFWLAAMLASPHHQARIQRFATPGVSQANINPTSLKSLTIPLPAIEEQREASQMLEALRARSLAERAEREMLLRAKAATGDALLTGRLRVPCAAGGGQ